MKTKEELNAIKQEVEAVNEKLYELSDEELEQVVGGIFTRGFRSIDGEKGLMSGAISRFSYGGRRPN